MKSFIPYIQYISSSSCGSISISSVSISINIRICIIFRISSSSICDFFDNKIKFISTIYYEFNLGNLFKIWKIRQTLLCLLRGYDTVQSGR
jgi:hypothetical protein